MHVFLQTQGMRLHEAGQLSSSSRRFDIEQTRLKLGSPTRRPWRKAPLFQLGGLLMLSSRTVK